MCGLVGVAGKLTMKTDKIFKTLLILDAIRGTDSTGVAAVDRTDEVRVVKQVGNPYELMQYKNFDTAMNKMNRALIGHNRYATQGMVNRKNAHPFEFDTLVGAHNGTLWQKHKLLNSNNFTVDSENLFHHIEEEGVDSFLKVADGAWSLVWWNKEEEELKFLRNKERPMWMATSQDDKLLVWASERWMIEVACGREDILWNEPISTAIDTLYSFPIDKDANLGKPRIRPAAVPERPVVVQYPQHQGYHRNFQHGQREKGGTNSVVIVPPFTPTPAQQLMLNESLKNSQVIPLPSKRQVLSIKKLVQSSNDSYCQQKGVLLEVLSEQVDKFGAKYLICFDGQAPRNFIRLYVKGTDRSNLIGKEIHADIGNKYAVDGEGIYYKVEHSSVKLTPIQLEFDQLNEEIQEIEKDSNNGAGKYFLDGRGKLISKGDWVQEYSKGCSWCTAPVHPDEPNRFTDTGDVICPDCASDSEITKYVNLK